jgi:hypothetical protein
MPTRLWSANALRFTWTDAGDPARPLGAGARLEGTP